MVPAGEKCQTANMLIGILLLTERQGPALSPAWPSGGHLTAAEEQQPVSFPDKEGKQIVLSRCVVCHDADNIVRTHGDQSLWNHIVNEMRKTWRAQDLKI